MKFAIVTILAAGLGFTSLPAHASVSYLTQARSVNARCGFTGSVTQTLTSPDFTPFNQMASVNDVGNLAGAATASQASTLDPTQITNVSHINATDGNQTSIGEGTSSFAATFSVDVPTPWSIVGNWSLNGNNAVTGPAQGTMSLNLQQQGGPTLYSASFVPNVNPTILSGVFAAGGAFLPGFTYSLTIILADHVQIIPGAANGIGDLNATLTFIPAPSAMLLFPISAGVALRRRRS